MRHVSLIGILVGLVAIPAVAIPPSLQPPPIPEARSTDVPLTVELTPAATPDAPPTTPAGSTADESRILLPLTDEDMPPARTADGPAPVLKGENGPGIVLLPLTPAEVALESASAASAEPTAPAAVVDASGAEQSRAATATLVGGFEIDDAAGNPTCGECHRATDNCCCDATRWAISGQWMYLQPRGTEIVYAIDNAACFGSPLGRAEQIDWDYESGYKVGIGKYFGDGSHGLFVNYSHFEANEADDATRATGPGTIRPLLTFAIPATCDGVSSTSARADASINFDRVEIDYKQFFSNECWKFDWLVGLAYGQLNQDVSAQYENDIVRVASDAFGWGARVGAGAEYGSGNVRGYGHADFTLLASNVDARFQQVNVLDGEVVHYSQDLDRIIPVLDLELGIAVDLTRHLSLRTGYVYSMWFNVITVPDWVAAVQAGDITGSVEDTVTFDGVFARLEFVW